MKKHFGKRYKNQKMKNDVAVITAPDDILDDGIRILCVSLSEEQQSLVSNALLEFDTSLKKVIVYLWNTTDPVDWMLDKKSKSKLIIFNADSTSENIVGYLAAHPNSYYFGNLKDLHQANKRAIYSSNEIVFLLDNI